MCKRRFPVLYIDDDDKVEPGADFEVPYSQSLAWLPVNRLRPFREYSPKGLSVRGYSTALKFHQKLEAARLGESAKTDDPLLPEKVNKGMSFDKDLCHVPWGDADGMLPDDHGILYNGSELESLKEVRVPSSEEYVGIGMASLRISAVFVPTWAKNLLSSSSPIFIAMPRSCRATLG